METENLTFVLDDLGCTGSESNLLECLPEHNCKSSADESAKVSCLRKGGTDSYSGTLTYAHPCRNAAIYDGPKCYLHRLTYNQNP